MLAKLKCWLCAIAVLDEIQSSVVLGFHEPERNWVTCYSCGTKHTILKSPKTKNSRNHETLPLPPCPQSTPPTFTIDNCDRGGAIQVPLSSSLSVTSTITSFTSSTLSRIALVSLLLAIEIGTRAMSTQLLSTHFWATIAPVFSVVLKLSPIPTILSIQKNKMVGGLPLLPYSAMANLTFALAAYGFMTKDLKVLLTHGVGFILSSFYCFQYLKNCSTDDRHLPGTPRLHKQISLSIVTFLLCSISFFPKDLATRIVGTFGMTLSCLMYAGPLCKLRDAIREKSAKELPLPFAIAGLLNSLSWFVYGYTVKEDIIIWFPCIVGLWSSSITISLNMLWGRG